ncbi:MAG: hypothetical protein KDD11_05515, partial [Acidobacteria bacterium]|nr:hypothetical protein [Acidobacteriota bacterium]
MIQAPPADLGARPLNRLTPWLWGLLALWVLIAALFAYRLAGQALDDVFITYRYARSFAEGQGLVFNPGERVFGTTAPGWALVLGTLSWLLHVPVNVLGTLSTAASLLALATLLLFESRRSGRTLEAAVAGTLILGTAYFWVHNGLEVFPALTLLA